MFNFNIHTYFYNHLLEKNSTNVINIHIATEDKKNFGFKNHTSKVSQTHAVLYDENESHQVQEVTKAVFNF